MNAVVVNGMIYSLSLRCSSADVPALGFHAGLRRTGFGGKGRARNQHGGLRQRPVRRASSTYMGMHGSLGNQARSSSSEVPNGRQADHGGGKAANQNVKGVGVGGVHEILHQHEENLMRLPDS